MLWITIAMLTTNFSNVNTELLIPQHITGKLLIRSQKKVSPPLPLTPLCGQKKPDQQSRLPLIAVRSGFPSGGPNREKRLNRGFDWPPR